MKLHKDYYGYYYPNQSQRAALAGLLVVLFPAFLPNLFGPLGHASPSIFSEWNAPQPRHSRLLSPALLLQSSVDQQSKLWAPLPDQGWKHCPEEPRSLSSSPKESTGYIQVFLDGGLNQQKMGICDAVAVAKILNATLVIPHLEVNPVWQDSSSFEDIFDVGHFIEALQGEVSIVKALPIEFSWSTREYYATGIRITRIKTAPVHASSDWYLENVLPILQRYGVAAISPFSHRLAFENLPPSIQHLRCKVNFEALAFVPHIRKLGETLVNRLRYPNRNQKAGTGSQTKPKMRKQGAEICCLIIRYNKSIFLLAYNPDCFNPVIVSKAIDYF
nr:O-fucosyltransferase 31-like [Malus domestica]